MNGEDVGPRVLPVLVHHYAKTKTERVKAPHRTAAPCPVSDLLELTHVTGRDVDEALEKGSQRTVLCGLRWENKTRGLVVTDRAAVAWSPTHSFIQVSDRRAGKLLHVVRRKPQLFLASVVASPPTESGPVQRSRSARDAGPTGSGGRVEVPTSPPLVCPRSG